MTLSDFCVELGKTVLMGIINPGQVILEGIIALAELLGA